MLTCASIAGKKSHRIHEHQFIGDMGLSSGLLVAQPMRGVATVTTNQQTTCLVWSRKQLVGLLERHPALATAFQRAVATDVMRKLRQSEDEETGRAVQQEMWRARYYSVLAAALSNGEITPQMRQQLCQFREIPRDSTGRLRARSSPCIHAPAHVHTCGRTHTHTRARARTQTRAHTGTHARTHTHTNTRR